MVSWTCPYCGESMHSSWDKRTDEALVCIHCDGTFENPYFSGRRKANEDTGTLHRHSQAVQILAATAKVPGGRPGGVPGKEKARLGKGGQTKKY